MTNPYAIWTQTLEELRGQMTDSTFNTLLLGSEPFFYNAKTNTFTISTRSASAADWLTARLSSLINTTLSNVAGFEATAVFVAQPSLPLPETSPGKPAEPLFPGFEPFRSNFVQYPRQFGEIVVPNGPPVLTAFVAAVIDNTIGIITNFRTNARREWWEASYTDITLAAGINSPASVIKAVTLARNRGYVIRASGRVKTYRFRLREEGEPVDNSVDNSQNELDF